MSIDTWNGETPPLGPGTVGLWRVLDPRVALASFVKTPFSVGERARPKGLFVFLLALVAGGLVALTSHPELLILCAVGAFVAVLYSAPPRELARRGQGELAALATLGPGVVLGAVCLFLGRAPASAVFPSFSVGLLVAALLIAIVLPVLAVAGGATPRALASPAGGPCAGVPFAGVPFAGAPSLSLRTASDGPIPVRARATAFLASVTGGLGLAVAFLI